MVKLDIMNICIDVTKDEVLKSAFFYFIFLFFLDGPEAVICDLTGHSSLGILD